MLVYYALCRYINKMQNSFTKSVCYLSLYKIFLFNIISLNVTEGDTE